MTILPVPYFMAPLPLPTYGKGSVSPVRRTGTNAIGLSLTCLLCSTVMKTISNTSKEGRVCPEGGNQHEQALVSNITETYFSKQ